MKYHSRSPEEWKKIDEEKMKLDRTSELRKRSLMFLFVNFVMVIAVIIVVKLYNLVNPAVRGAVGSLRFAVQVPDSVVLGQPLKVRVKLINTSKSEVEFTIERFEFHVEDEMGSVVYSFVHEESVSSNLEGLSSVLVFDLARETVLNDLKAGRYRIRVKALLNGRETEIVKGFEVVSKLSLVLGGFEPFLFVGEGLDLNVGVRNDNFTSIEISVRSILVSLKRLNGGKPDEMESRLSGVFELDPGESALVKRYVYGNAFTSLGTYELDVRVETNVGEIERRESFRVITRDQISIDGVRFYIEVPIQIVPGKEFDLIVSLYNDTKEDRYIPVEEFLVSLGNGEQVLSERIGSFRVWIPPYSKVGIYESKGLKIGQSGVYELLLYLKTPRGDLSKRMKINAGGV